MCLQINATFFNFNIILQYMFSLKINVLVIQFLIALYFYFIKGFFLMLFYNYLTIHVNFWENLTFRCKKLIPIVNYCRIKKKIILN